MFRTDRKTKTVLLSKPLNELVPIVTPAELLACPKRQDLIDKLSEVNLLDPARYNSVCLRLIHNMINYCQNLPETDNSYYSSSAGLLDHALNRTEAAMALFKQYLIIGDSGKLSEEQSLWAYALFSASMLRDINKLQTDFTIDLYDHNGQYLTQWHPLLESMASLGSYYHHTFQASSDEPLRGRLNILFAKLVMPNSGFSWLASNLRVLKIWLALLDEQDESGGGTLKAILSRADDIAIQRELNALQLKQQRDNSGGRGARIGTFVDVLPESNQAKRNTGIKFIRWLQKELAQGNLILNKGPLRIVPGGLVMSQAMYQLFVKANPEYKRWHVVHHGFISLGAHKISLDGTVVLRNDLNDGDQMQDGIFLDRGGLLLPDEVKVADHEGNIHTASAVEVMHLIQQSDFSHLSQGLPHLTENGQWQVPSHTEAASLSDRLGTPNHG